MSVTSLDDLALKPGQDETPRSQSLALHIAGRTRPFAFAGDGPWTIGRSDVNDICFPDDRFCSRLQARISKSGQDWVLDPISTSNPTRVNARTVDKPTVIVEGDVIEFAKQSMTLSGAHANQPGNLRANLRSVDDACEVVDGLMVMRRDGGQSAAANALYFDHPTVSRRHARFSVRQNEFYIEDLGSTNGTRVNGTRISGRTKLSAGDDIAIGVFSLAFDGRSIKPRARGKGALLAADSISKVVRPKPVQPPLTLLDHVDLAVEPGNLVCIIGASGSGKSTLMNVMSGRKRPSSGQVTFGDIDVHAFFDTLKQSMAYVPQNDLLHEVLTLRQALTFVAELRLPRDLTADARARIVEEAAESVGLGHRLDLKISSLSGGQKKRASLATEILSRPDILFLDEVTSGLDENTDREIMALLKRLTRSGMTIVCVTHTLANILEFADRVVVMGEGGHLTFYGSPQQMLSFFGIRYLGEVFGALDKSGTQTWRQQFEQSVTGRGIKEASRGRARGTSPPRDQPGTLLDRFKLLTYQFGVLCRRNIALLWGDQRTLLMAAIQSMAIGGLLGYAYSDFGSGTLEVSNSKLSFLLVFGITCLWIGCAGAAKEIVGELPIYLRERDINLSTLAFVLSKFVTVGVFTVLQIGLLTLVCSLIIEQMPAPAFEQFLVAALTAVGGAGLGLVISSVSNSRDQAAVIVPLALAPQLIFGSGLISTLSSGALFVSKLLIPAYWSREAMTAALVSSERILKFDLNAGGAVAVTAPSLSSAVLALTAQTAFWVFLAIAIMHLRHARKTE